MKNIPIQRRMGIMRPDPEGGCAIRVSHRAERKRGTGTISPPVSAPLRRLRWRINNLLRPGGP